MKKVLHKKLLSLIFILMLAIGLFIMPGTASAGVYTSDTHIAVADSDLTNLKGQTVFFHTDLIEENAYITLSYDGLTYFNLVIDNAMRSISLFYGFPETLPDDPEQIIVTIASTNQAPFPNDIVEYTFPSDYDFIIDTSIQNDVIDIMYIDIEPIPTETPTPTATPDPSESPTPIDEVSGFLNGASIGAIFVLFAGAVGVGIVIKKLFR